MTRAALAVELYASSVVSLRGCYSRMSDHEPPLDELDRVAQCIARAAPDPSLAIAMAIAPAESDDAARGVQSAFIAARMAHLSGATEPGPLAAVLAALYVDAGKARLASAAALDLSVFSALPDSLDQLAPAATVAAAITGARPTHRQWAALTAFEVAWLERPRLGPLYQRALPPRLLSRALVSCRALLAKVAPAGGALGQSPFSALHALCAAPDADRSALGLLASAVGHYPVGTVVEVDGGGLAVVGPEVSDDSGRPQLRSLEGAPLPDATIARVLEPEAVRPGLAFALAQPPA